jgi:hypothetical protein
MDYKSIISGVRDKFKKLFSEEFEELNIPSGKDKEEVVAYVRALYDDSAKWRKTSFKKRFKDQTDPVEFWKQCRKLRNNLHWDVWGHRGTDLHEITEPVIADQLRVRKTYLTSNYHDIVVNPNIKNIDQIIKQERDETDWSDFVDKAVDVCLTDGTVICKEILDKSEDEFGISRSVVCDTESIYPTPEVVSLKAVDGCWYLVDATMQNLHQVVRDFKDLDVSKIKATTKADQDRNKYDEEKKSYDKTQFVEVLTAYIDDNRLEPIPFDVAEFDRRTAMIHEGQDPDVKPEDNHKEFMKRYLDWLENVVVPQDETSADPEDQQFIDSIVELTLMIVDEHAKYSEKNPEAKRKKYPNGRRIVVVGDQVAEDGDNPLRVPWRDLYYILPMEKDPHCIWGRGIPEIMWEENYHVDLMQSRMADMSVTASMPEKWMNVNDKEVLAQSKVEYNNNPKEIKWFASTPPTIVQGRSVQEFVQLLNSKMESLQQKIGVNETSLGGSPSSHASGDLVELLLRQSMTLISGDVNKNLNEFVNQIMETKLAIYKKFYTVPKYYMINGIPTAITVSDLLSKMMVSEDGKMVEKDIPIIQIHVRPNSNFPNQWENDIAFAIQTANTPTVDGSPMVPKEWVMSIFAQRYPEFAEGGKFYSISQATQIGLKVIQEQQAKEQADAETLQQVSEKFKSAGLKAVLGEKPINTGETNATQETS